MGHTSSKISVFGAFGFIGGEFCRQYNNETIRVPKHEQESPTNRVLYFISTTDNYNVYESPIEDIETNLVWFMQVLSACHTKHKKNLEFTLISTWFVFGSTPSSQSSPLLETSSCDPKGFYSITAKCREQLLISYCETFGIKYKILRLANVLGYRDNKVSKKKNALQFLIDAIVHNEDIELYDGGNFYRDYIDVRDCAKAIKIAMGGSEKIYNISNGNSHLFKDLINVAVRYSESTSNVWDKTDKPEFHSVVQSKDVFLSNEKLKKLGYTPEFTIDDTIKEIIDHYKGK